MSDEQPTYQWWATAWNELGDESNAAGDSDYAEHCYYLGTQNQRAANRDSRHD